MLVEIQCNDIKGITKEPRKITFSNGLNIIAGNDNGDNSVGKTTTLLLIDFCFGGSYFIKAKGKELLDSSIINFSFLFNSQQSYYSRDVNNPDSVNICDETYKIIV